MLVGIATEVGMKRQTANLLQTQTKDKLSSVMSLNFAQNVIIQVNIIIIVLNIRQSLRTTLILWRILCQIRPEKKVLRFPFRCLFNSIMTYVVVCCENERTHIEIDILTATKLNKLD